MGWELLLEKLPSSEYEQATLFTRENCETIEKLANLNITYDNRKPGVCLMNALQRRGISVEQYRHYRDIMLTSSAYYQPKAKFAILIGNKDYHNLSKLGTPEQDCNSLTNILQRLGFIVCVILNTKSNDLKEMLIAVFGIIPEDSYVLVFYAGHGCEICNTKCMLGVDCPTEDLQLRHCLTENFLLNEMGKCKANLCVLIMDMCRVDIDRKANPQIYQDITNVETYKLNSSVLICYSTQSSQVAYEYVEIECSDTVNSNETYELKTRDLPGITPVGSQYITALCSRLEENVDISTLLDKVHGDLESARKQQRPIKVQCGVAKRSLHDPIIGDVQEVLDKLQKVGEKYAENLKISVQVT